MNKKPIAVFDIDGTIFRSSLFIELTNKLIELGVFPKDTYRVFSKQYEDWLNREGGYDDYLKAMVKAYEGQIHGVKVSHVQAISEVVISQLSLRTYRYGRNLIKKLRRTHFLAAISGSPQEAVEHFANKYKFDTYVATTYNEKGGVYTGNFTLGNANKDKILKKIVKENNLTFKNSVGVGDTESDIPFLSLVDHPVAFNPNQALFNAAQEKDWQVVVERKDKIYELSKDDNGYRLS